MNKKMLLKEKFDLAVMGIQYLSLPVKVYALKTTKGNCLAFQASEKILQHQHHEKLTRWLYEDCMYSICNGMFLIPGEKIWITNLKQDAKVEAAYQPNYQEDAEYLTRLSKSYVKKHAYYLKKLCGSVGKFA